MNRFLSFFEGLKFYEGVKQHSNGEIWSNLKNFSKIEVISRKILLLNDPQGTQF